MFGILIACGVWISSICAAVTIPNGTIQGTVNNSKNVEKFLGIPYAEPPIGDLRLRQAIPLRKSYGNLTASHFGHSCFGPYRSQQPNASEDCLTLNVWRPTGLMGSEAPVMVWFHGGGLSGGSTSSSLYEGTNMVSLSKEINKPAILVSINYRLSAFGFLNGKQMAELGLLNIGHIFPMLY